MSVLASTAGRSWAARVRTELIRDGRRAMGMWPGTVSEARALTERMFEDSSLTSGNKVAREGLARCLYAAARQEWKRWSECEPPTAVDGAWDANG